MAYAYKDILDEQSILKVLCAESLLASSRKDQWYSRLKICQRNFSQETDKEFLCAGSCFRQLLSQVFVR